MALAVDTPRDKVLGDVNDIPVEVSTKIYEGAAVGIVSGTGFARGLVALDAFAGIAQRQADNSAGAAAAITVKVLRKGTLANLAVAGVVVTSLGAVVYAAADGTFTLTSTSNTVIGKVVRYISNGFADVEFKNYALVTS